MDFLILSSCWDLLVEGRMVEGVNSSMIYLIYGKNFCKCYNVRLPSTIIKKKKKKGRKGSLKKAHQILSDLSVYNINDSKLFVIDYC
jgi:hypothetical protein